MKTLLLKLLTGSLYFLGYVWSFLTVILGLLLWSLGKALGQVDKSEWRGPARIIRMEGAWADWMQESNSSGYVFYGHTIGFCVFLYTDVEDQLLKHECRHVWQQMVLGPIDPIYQLFAMLYGLIRYRSAFLAYRNLWTEWDARKVAGEESVAEMRTLSGEP